MKNKKLIVLYLLAILCLLGILFFSLRSCTNSSDAQRQDTVRIDTVSVMLTQMQSCSRLHTAEVKVHKIITHDDVMKLSGTVLGKQISLNVPTGKRKVAIPLYATIKASIDLTKLSTDAIQRYGDKIEVFLPQPDIVITETHIDHDGIKQYVALTRSRFSDEELQSYEKQGRTAIERDIPKMNLISLSRESAARQLIPIIEAMGFKEQNITISFRDDGKHNTIIRKTE